MRKRVKVSKKTDRGVATIGGVEIVILSHPGKGSVRRSVWDKAITKVTAMKKLTLSKSV